MDDLFDNNIVLLFGLYSTLFFSNNSCREYGLKNICVHTGTEFKITFFTKSACIVYVYGNSSTPGTAALTKYTKVQGQLAK